MFIKNLLFAMAQVFSSLRNIAHENLQKFTIFFDILIYSWGHFSGGPKESHFSTLKCTFWGFALSRLCRGIGDCNAGMVMSFRKPHPGRCPSPTPFLKVVSARTHLKAFLSRKGYYLVGLFSRICSRSSGDPFLANSPS